MKWNISGMFALAPALYPWERVIRRAFAVGMTPLFQESAKVSSRKIRTEMNIKSAEGNSGAKARAQTLARGRWRRGPDFCRGNGGVREFEGNVNAGERPTIVHFMARADWETCATKQGVFFEGVGQPMSNLVWYEGGMIQLRISNCGFRPHRGRLRNGDEKIDWWKSAAFSRKPLRSEEGVWKVSKGETGRPVVPLVSAYFRLVRLFPLGDGGGIEKRGWRMEDGGLNWEREDCLPTFAHIAVGGGGKRQRSGALQDAVTPERQSTDLSVKGFLGENEGQ
jgi:hypothetical protein